MSSVNQGFAKLFCRLLVVVAVGIIEVDGEI